MYMSGKKSSQDWKGHVKKNQKLDSKLKLHFGTQTDHQIVYLKQFSTIQIKLTTNTNGEH